LIVDFIASKCYTHDMAHAANLHAQMQENDVMVGDCAFASFAHLALLLQGKLHGVFRMHQRKIVCFKRGRKQRSARPKSQRRGAPTSRWLQSLGRWDQLVEYVKPKTRPGWMDAEAYAQLPATIVVRELRYQINRPGFRTQEVTLVTTLLDAQVYSADELAALYGARWQIETNLKHLKQTSFRGGDGCAAQQDADGRGEGVVDVFDRVQPGASFHARRGDATRGGPVAHQLHRRAGRAASPRPAPRSEPTTGRASDPRRASRAARDQKAKGPLLIHDQAA